MKRFARTGKALIVLVPLLVARCNCNEELGSAAPPVPKIDICISQTPGADETCYEAIKQARYGELCTGDGECLLPELDADLGRIDAGATGVLAVRVRNLGGADLTFFNPTRAPGTSNRFSIDPPDSPGDGPYAVIPGGGEFVFTVELKGTLCGTHGARIVLTSNDAEMPRNAPLTFDPGQPDTPIYLNITGFVGGPCLCPLPPSEIDFGNVPVGQTKNRRFSFESCGDADLDILNTRLGFNPMSYFNIGGTIFMPGDVLQPGEQGHIDISYSPGQVAPPPDYGELWIETNAPTAQPYYLVPLYGRGIPRPSCRLDAIPSDASFGQVSGSGVRSFRIFNSGEIPCRLYDVERTSGSTEFTITAGAPPPDVSLQPNDSHTIDITYSPFGDQFDEAVFTATADDVDGFASTVDIHVSGNPVIPEEGCGLDIQPDFGDFGEVTVGGSSSINFELTNVSEGSLWTSTCTINSATLAAGVPDFRLGSLGAFAGFLPPGMTTSLTVFFEPESEGVKTGNLRFSSNSTTGGTTDIQLWGNALGARLCVDVTGAAPATLQCGVTQPCDTLDYGAATSDTTQDITLTNCGAGSLRIRGLNMDPAGGLAFIKEAPVAAALPLNIGAGQSMTVTIRYRPTNPNGDFGGLDVLSNASNAEVTRINLRGNYSGNCTRIIRCSPNPVQFGSQQVGVPAVQSAICTNFGSDPLAVTNVQVSGDSSLSLLSGTFVDLQPSDTFIIQIECDAQNPGNKTGTVSITSDACDSTPYELGISCTGLEIPIPECLGSDTYEPREKWRWEGSSAYPEYDDVWCTPTVINLTDDNGDGNLDVLDTPDVIFTALKSSMSFGTGGGGQPGPDAFCQFNNAQPAIMVAVSGDTGAELWTWGTLPVGDPGDPNAMAFESEANQAAADIDGDGKPEIIGVKYTYIPPPDDCEMSDLECCLKGKYAYGALIALEHDGSFKWESERWHMSEHVMENAGSVSIGDMDGDGFPEISFGNAVFDHNGLLIFEGATASGSTAGQGEGGAGHGPFSVFADLNGDGTNELVAGRTAFMADGSIYYDRADLADGLTTIANLDS
ncbi:MAG: choice-of-anchor D domain-containing protein, partial [Myxococcota bacterium]